MEIRDLKSKEIECKIATINSKGLSLLLYKTARTDMQILDETFGQMNWQCEYKEVKGNLYCTILVYNSETKEWISKQDCGVESAFGDKEKGEASDAFKRAGFKWGIGIELYTSPFIWINSENCNLKETNKKDAYGNPIYTCRDKFIVEKIEIIDKEITGLSIINTNLNNKRVFVYIKPKKEVEQNGL